MAGPTKKVSGGGFIGRGLTSTFESSTAEGLYIPTDSSYSMLIRDSVELHYMWNGYRCKKPNSTNWTSVNLQSGSTIAVEGGVIVATITDKGTTFYREGVQHALNDGERHVFGISNHPSMNGTGTATDSWQVGVWDSINGDGVRISRSSANGGYLTVVRFSTFDGAATSTPYAEEAGDHYFVGPDAFLEIEFDTTLAFRALAGPQGPVINNFLVGESDSGYDTVTVTWANRSGVTQKHILFHHEII